MVIIGVLQLEEEIKKNLKILSPLMQNVPTHSLFMWLRICWQFIEPFTIYYEEQSHNHKYLLSQ